jgi:hypothetical protein
MITGQNNIEKEGENVEGNSDTSSQNVTPFDSQNATPFNQNKDSEVEIVESKNEISKLKLIPKSSDRNGQISNGISKKDIVSDNHTRLVQFEHSNGIFKNENVSNNHSKVENVVSNNHPKVESVSNNHSNLEDVSENHPNLENASDTHPKVENVSDKLSKLVVGFEHFLDEEENSAEHVIIFQTFSIYFFGSHFFYVVVFA